MVTVGIHNTGKGPETPAIVDSLGRLEVAVHIPEIADPGTPNRFRYFSQLTSSDGDGTGTTNMRVDGSSTAQVFTVNSSPAFDIFIMGVLIFIGDTAVTHGKFGNVNALTNGWDLAFRESGEDTFIIEKAKTGGQVIITSATALAWGNGATSFELTNFNADNDDATVVIVPLARIVPGGLRIGRGTQDQLRAIVNDDLTGLIQFEARALGYRHFP